MSNKKPTHVYMGRKKCGCCVIIFNDEGDKHTAEHAGMTIRAGCTLEWIEWQHYVDDVSNEDTFMDCPHKPPEQATMFNEAQQ